MLDQMRAAAKSWVAKLFLGLLGASFLVWGVPSSFLPQIGGGILFSSGDSSVRPSDYSFALRDLLVRRGINRLPSASELRDSGFAADILLRLQFNLLLDEEARQMRLGADEDAALQILRQDTLFHNINGDFDRNSFLSFLSQAGFTQAEIIENLAAQARRDQLLDTITAGLEAPDVLYKTALLYERETRAINYVMIDAGHLGEIESPADDVLAAWFEDHRNEFRAPEYRTFTYLSLNAEMLAKPQDISEEALQDYYEANKQRFATPEQREFSQLRFDDRAAADAAYAKWQAGASFEELVREQGREMLDIQRGPLARSELPSLMAAEIFALPQGQVSEVINDLAGPVIIRIDAIEAAKIPPLAEISETLRTEMALAQAKNAMRQTMRDIEEARFEGATLPELASQYELPLHTATVDEHGFAPANQQESLPDASWREALLAQVFASQIGIDRDPILGQDDYVWYQLDDITAARNLEFDEVRDGAARASWVSEETGRRLAEKAEQLKAELQAGKALELIAQENGLSIHRAAGLQRATQHTDLGNDAIRAIFATPASPPQNAFNVIYPEDLRDAALLFQVTDSAEPLSTDPQSLSDQQREAISARLAQDLTGQFINLALHNHAIEQNQALLNELLSDNNVLSLR